MIQLETYNASFYQGDKHKKETVRFIFYHFNKGDKKQLNIGIGKKYKFQLILRDEKDIEDLRDYLTLMLNKD